MTTEIVITPELPYWGATFDCQWNSARRIAADHYHGAELAAHIAAIDEAEADADREAAAADVADKKHGRP